MKGGMLINSPPSKHLLFALCLAAAPLTTGCLATSVVGEIGTGGGTAASAASTETVGTTGAQGAGGSGEGPRVALALRHDQFPPVPASYRGTAADPTLDPATLYIEIDSSTASCAQPFGRIVDGACSTNYQGWHLEIGLPVGSQQVGRYPLNASPVFVSVTTQNLDQNLPPNTLCSGGTFGFLGSDAEIRIESIDTDKLVVHVSGTSSPETGTTMDGDYTVLRCEPSTQVAVNAINVRENHLPPVAQDPALDPLTVFIKLGTQPLTCMDPNGQGVDCVPSWNVSIALPLAYQKTGTYSLSDPAIIPVYSVQNGGSGSSCPVSSGDFRSGTLEIEEFAIDPTTATVRLSGTSIGSAVGTDPSAVDGEYFTYESDLYCAY